MHNTYTHTQKDILFYKLDIVYQRSPNHTQITYL